MSESIKKYPLALVPSARNNIEWNYINCHATRVFKMAYFVLPKIFLLRKNWHKCKKLYSNVAPFILERNPHCKRTIQNLKIICIKAEDINTRLYIFDSSD
jgi:hypothetical protein